MVMFYTHRLFQNYAWSGFHEKGVIDELVPKTEALEQAQIISKSKI
jgi:hypothetical protein